MAPAAVATEYATANEPACKDPPNVSVREMVVVGADRFRRKKPSAAAKVRIADGPDTVNAVRAAPPDVFETDTKTLWKAVEDWTWTESEPPLVTGVLAVTVTLGPPLAAGGAPDW